jgi:hypothetical protein
MRLLVFSKHFHEILFDSEQGKLSNLFEIGE